MICNTGNALRRLFDVAKHDMKYDELRWLSGLAENADLQAENIAATLNALAMMIAGDHSSAPGNDELSRILWGLASQAETVAALGYIGSESDSLASELKDKSNGQ